MADPVAGDLLGGLRKLLRDKDYHGDVSGPATPVEILRDGTVRVPDSASSPKDSVRLADYRSLPDVDQDAQMFTEDVLAAIDGRPAPEIRAESETSSLADSERVTDEPPTLPEIESEAARFIEELFDELDEQVSTATPPVRLRQNSWVSLQSAHSDFVSEAVLETQYGIPRQDQRRFQKMADRFGVVFDVRPANPASVGWRARGAVPKPLELKAKTLNELDVHLGMRRERIGLVAYFEPLRPDLANVPQDLRERVLKRYEDRSAEYTQLAESMRGLEESGRFRVVDGVVQERKGEGFRNVTGDNDVYDIRLPEDGSSLHEADYERMVYLLTGREMGVEHGALKYWEPETEFQRKIRDDIDEQHRIVPLVRFGPGLPPTLVHLGDDQSERRPSSMPTAAPAPRPNLTSAYRPEPVGTEHFESLRPWQAERRADGAFPAFGRPGTGTRTAYRPPLRAATDSTLGINGARSVDDGGGVLEAREFFATDEVLDRAREALRRTRTGIGLEVRDSRLVLDDHGRQQVLHRVVPRMPERLTDDSRGFAGIVHGATPDTLLFEAPGGRTATARVGTDDGTEVSGTFNLAEGLSEIVEHGDPSTVDTSRAAEIVARDRRDTGGSPDRPLPGHRYGRMLDHAPGVDQQRARLDEAARRMGVNQFAWAKPGQMYVRSSIPGEGADGRPDYTDRAGMRRPAGYHFATVIAESTDGRAQITLENRPHTTEQDAAVREAIERNLVHHHAELGNLSSELAKRMERARAAGDDAEVTRLGRHRELAEALSEIARTGYDRAEPSARHRAWQAMAAELDILPGPDRWFFRMYTREPGETFFDQQALSYAPDAKAPGLNPLVTTALGGLGEIPSAKVPFAPGRSTADRDALAGVRAVARDVARAAVLRGDLGLGPVKVRITGYGGNGFFPGSRGTTAQRRAGQVRDHFREVLAEELTALQGDNRTVGVRDVELSVETGRLPSDQASADRHRVTVEVAFDDAPNTPERQAATGYDRAVHGLPELELPRSELRARLAEYTALAGEGALEHHALPEGTRERLIALDRSLAALPEIGRARVRALVNEALLAASLVPTREQARPPKRSHGGVEVDRRAVQPVTPARLTQLLDELNVGIASGADPLTSGTSSLPGLVVPADAALPVRLAALGLVNLSVDARIALSADPLFTALSKNPAALTEALFAAAGNEEQYFLNTAATAAVDTSVRGRVPTLAGLLQVGGAVADATEHGLGQASAESRAEPDRPFGRTMEEMVRKRVAEARAEFSGLEQRALRLVGADQADRAVRREWRQLTARWARSMQKLAAAELNVDQVPVLTRNVLCDSRMSRMLVSPLIVDRGSRRRGRVDHKSYVERMRRRLAPDTDVTPVGSATAADGTRPDISLAEGLRTEDGRTAFWARVAETGGAVLSLPHHAVHVRATTVDGRRVFFLNDPKDAYPALLTPDEFVKWATSGHAYANAEFFPADTADDARAATTGSAASAGEPAAPDLGETSVPRVGTAQSDVVSISAHPRVGRRSSIASSVGEISPFDLRRTASEPELTRHRTSSRTSSRGRETPRSDSPETRWHGGRHLSPGRRFGGDDGLLQVPVRRSTGGYAGAFFPTHESSLETSALWRFPFDDLHTHLPETIQELPEDADSVVPDGERSEVDSLLPETAIPDDAEPADTALAVWSEPLLEVSDRVAERAEGALPSAVPVEQARVEAERLVRALPSVLSAVDEDTFQFLHDGLTSMVVDLIADGTTPEAAWEEARVARLRDELEALRGPVEEAHYTLSAEEIRGRAPEPEASPDSAAAAEQALDRWLAPIMEASGRLEDLEESAETAGAVEQARAEAEEWAGELPSGAGIVDEETRQTLHDGLVSMLTDLIAGGVSRADAWEDADVSRLREDLESLRGEAESAHYRRTALEMLEQHTMGKWERAIWDASARVEEREEGSVPSVVPVEQARAEAERLTGGLPSALPTADEWSRRTLHDGLVSILTEHIAGGVDPRVAWHRPDVVRLRGDLEMLRGPAESAHYTRTAMEILGPVRSGGANEAATGQVTEPAPTETRSKARRVWERWEERVGEAVERVRQREQAAPRAVASARQTVESLIGGLPRAAAGTDTTARQLVHDALSALLTELISAGASPRAAWDHPDVAPLRESAESLRELSSVRTHYTGVPLALTRLPASVTAATPAPPVVVEASGSGQGFQRSGTPSTELVGEDRSSPDSDEPVGDDDSTYSAEFLPIWTADRRYEADTRGPIEWLSEPHREDGSAPEPGRLSAAVAEFEAHLSLEHRPVSSFREEAAALLGDRPAPRVGYGPDAAEQQGLWRSMVDAVASALSRDANAEGLTSELRAGFERLRTFDDLAAWAETQLAQFRNRIDQARARLDERRQDALPGDQPPEGRERWQEQLRWREQLRRQEAEDLLGALPPTVPGGAPERIRRAFHEGITTMLTDLLLHEEHPTYAWTELGDVRQAAEAVRLSSRHLRDATPETPFGQFPEPGRGFYSEDLREEDLPTYDETQDSGATRHSDGAPGYTAHPVADEPPAYEDSMAEFDDGTQEVLPYQVEQMADLLTQLPRNEIVALRTRLLSLVLPPEGLTPDELARRFPLHDLMLSALAYHAFLDGDQPGAAGERAQMLALLDKPGIHDTLGAAARRRPVLDDAHHALRNMFTVARSYAETSSEPRSAPRPESTLTPDVDLSEVDFVPLRSRSGVVVGVGFPLSDQERGVLREAFENRAVVEGEFSVPLHHGENGFSVRARNGRIVSLDERAVVRLLSSVESPGDASWRQRSSLVFLSCWVSSPRYGNRIVALAELLHDAGLRGDVHGFDTRVEVRRDGTVRPLPDGAEPAEGSVVFAAPSDEPVQPLPGVVAGRRSDPVAVAEIRARLERMAEAAFTGGQREYHKMLGPDLFGLGRTPEAPQALRGLDYDELSAAEGMTLLQRLDMTKPFPEAETLTYDALAAAEQDVFVSDWTDKELQYWDSVGIQVSALPARRETPRLLHGIWLGGPLAADGTTGLFQQRFADSAKTLGGRAVLWTDVPRKRIEAAVRNESDASLADVREMVKWARENDIHLVNVDEVFNAEAPMRLDPFYRAELTKGTGRGYAAASDTLRVYIEARFGGLYMDGDDILHDPDVLLNVHESPEGYAFGGIRVGDSRVLSNNSPLAMAKGHPLAWLYLVQLEQNYDQTQLEIFPAMLATASKEFYATPQGRLRRNSVLQRTGPDTFFKLRERLGLKVLPLMSGIGLRSSQSWAPGSSTEPTRPRVTAEDIDGTALLTEKVVQSLIRQLRNRQGDLFLTDVADLVFQHTTPDVVWTAALEFLASVPALRKEVRTATVERFVNGSMTAISLPEEVAALLHRRAGAQLEFLGDALTPVTMSAPAGRGIEPAGPDWRTPIPSEVMTDFALDLLTRRTEGQRLSMKRRAEQMAAAPSAKRVRLPEEPVDSRDTTPESEVDGRAGGRGPGLRPGMPELLIEQKPGRTGLTAEQTLPADDPAPVPEAPRRSHDSDEDLSMEESGPPSKKRAISPQVSVLDGAPQALGAVIFSTGPGSPADLSGQVLQGLLDGLRDHPGHLDLAAVAALVEDSPEADEVWNTVIAFLAADPGLATQVRTVTLRSVDEAGVPRRVVLPPLAAEFLHLSEDPPTSPAPGEFTHRAELTRPAWLPLRREADPTTKEDHGHDD
ncbi:hypothetical protein [Amycolatopsis regifaucium]|nr:hypothetical protein [Amycolatopsis regifaucium]